jgi:hypothetical protein
VRDLAAALGLISVQDRPPLLVIPRPPEFTVDDARGRLVELQRAYPEKNQLSIPDDLPDGVAGPLRRAAGEQYEHLLEAGRREVARQLQKRAGPDRQETPQLWRDLRTWLESPEELTAWRSLAAILGKLHNPDWADPVVVLANFLKKDRFELDVRRPTLTVPIPLNVRPVGKLLIYHSRVSAQAPALVLEVADTSTDMAARVRTYTFRPEGEGRLLAFQPGDSIWATLQVERDGSPDWVLTWARSRSSVYQFEHLTTAPQLHRKDQEPAQGETAAGVALTFSPPSGVPAVPDLMPVVKLK